MNSNFDLYNKYSPLKFKLNEDIISKYQDNSAIIIGRVRHLTIQK